MLGVCVVWQSGECAACVWCVYDVSGVGMGCAVCAMLFLKSVV